MGIGRDRRLWGSADFRVGVMESLSEKVTFKLRSGRHEAANQEPRPEKARGLCVRNIKNSASRAQV